MEASLGLLKEIGIPISGNEEACQVLTMMNHVVNPPVPFAVLQNNSPTPISPQITVFRSVFKTKFRCHPYADLTETFVEANAMVRKTTSSEISHQYGESASQRHIESLWISKINNWKRNNFLTEAIDYGVLTFKTLFNYRLPQDNYRFYLEHEIHVTADMLMEEAEKELISEIPPFEEQRVVREWCMKLRVRLCDVVSEALAKNNENMVLWENELQTPCDEYVKIVNLVLDKNPFLSQEKLKHVHEQAKLKTASQIGVDLNTWNVMMKAAWDSKIDVLFGVLVSNWKSAGMTKIKQFLIEIKTSIDRLLKTQLGIDVNLSMMELGLEENLDVWWKTLVEAADKSCSIIN